MYARCHRKSVIRHAQRVMCYARQPGSRPGSQPGSQPGSRPGSLPGSQPSQEHSDDVELANSKMRLEEQRTMVHQLVDRSHALQALSGRNPIPGHANTFGPEEVCR